MALEHSHVRDERVNDGRPRLARREVRDGGTGMVTSGRFHAMAHIPCLAAVRSVRATTIMTAWYIPCQVVVA